MKYTNVLYIYIWLLEILKRRNGYTYECTCSQKCITLHINH